MLPPKDFHTGTNKVVYPFSQLAAYPVNVWSDLTSDFH